MSPPQTPSKKSTPQQRNSENNFKMHVSPDGAIDIDIIKYGDYDEDEDLDPPPPSEPTPPPPSRNKN